MAALAAPIHSSSGKDLEVPSDVRPAGASDASPRGPLDILADNSQPPTPSLSSGSDAVPKANAGVSKNVVPAGTSVSRPAQFDGLVSEFDKDVSSLLANLASGLLNLKTRQNALTSMPSEKAEKAKPDPAEKVPDEKKAAELISVPKISPDEWVHLFETTGLCQAYDLESEHPTPAGIPLFIVRHGKENTWEDENNNKHPVPEKPAFIVDDKIRRVEEETFTERRKYLAESGFSSADLAVVVPYVQASVQSSKSEKEQSQQAAKRVFVTTRDEYPRCQLNITASVHSGYLKVNPQFIEEVKLVTSKQIEDYKQLKEKVKRLKEAVQETLFETPLQTILKEYAKDDVAKEILGNMHKKYEDWLREWEVQKKEGEAQQKSKVTGGADEAGSSPPLAAALPTAVVTRSDSRDERFTEGASSVSAGAGATPRAESSSSGSAEAMKESAESVPAGQAAEQKSAPLEGIDPGPSALPAGRRPGKEEASLEGPKDESSTLDTEARGATQAGKEVLNASKSKREGPIFNGGGGIGSVPTASVPEHGETLAVEGKGRLARMLSGMLSFGRGSSSPKAETGDMRGKSGIGAVGVVEGTLPVGEGVGPENQEQKTEQKKTEPETPPDKRLLLTYDFLRLALERLREAQEQLKPEREKIVVAMQDIIVRFGAVWIERITLGGQHISTRTEESMTDSRSRERTRTTSASLGGHEAGAAARFSVLAGKSKQAQAETSKNTRSSEVHATGGDTITFRSDNRTDWVNSIRATQNWRIIRYRKIQELSTAPGLDIPVVAASGDEDRSSGGAKKPTVRQLLKDRLQVVVEDVAELEAKKDPPRRYLDQTLRRDLKGFWYGFDCALQEGGFNPGPSILQLRINQTLEFQVTDEKENVRATGVRFHGIDQDSASYVFEVEGYVLEVEGFGGTYDGRLYEPSGAVRMERRYPGYPKKLRYSYSGHLDSTGMHGLWRRSDNKTGSWTLAPVLFIPLDSFDDNWTFTERETHFNESQRRWILPTVPRSLDPESAHLAKRIDPDLVKGLWQGYLLPRKTSESALERDPLCDLSIRYPDEDGEWGDGEPEGEDGEPGEEEENDGDQGGKDGDPDGEEGEQEEEDEDDDEDEDEDADPQQEDDEIECDIPSVPLKTFPAGDLQPKRVKLVIEKCELVGGRTGRQRFRLEGKLREENVRYYTFEGSLHQVPARPKEHVTCPHDYPYLGKVDLRLTPAKTWRSSSNRDGKGLRYRGHLDHLGMHGFVIREEGGPSSNPMENHVDTFGFMPVTNREARKPAQRPYFSRKKSAVV